MIDLHIHTTASDGTVSPSGVVRMAKAVGLSAVAITDHDCVDGIPEFRDQCRAVGIEAVNGIEIGVEHDHGTMHLLGYFIDPVSSPLKNLIETIGRERKRRMEKIVRRLVRVGVEVKLDEVYEVAGSAPPGRPHVALMLSNRGVVGSIEEAFVHFLREGAPAYQSRVKPSVTEAIEAIHAAGGVAVLAHPVTLGLESRELFDVVEDLTSKGLSGVEVYYPTQQENFRQELLLIARSLSLAVTGGSDFHGDVKPDFKIGVGKGDLNISDSLLHDLKKRSISGKERGR